MGVIYLLIIISLSVALLFFVAFLWAVSHGQYTDSYTPSVRMLFEDEVVDKRDDSKLLKQKKQLLK